MMKKGNVRDILFLAIVLFFIGVFCFIGVFTFNSLSDKILASSMNESKGVVSSLTAMKEDTRLIDYFGLAVFVGMALAIVITGWFIGGNPLFMVVYFLVLVCVVVVCMVLSNVWENVTGSSLFGVTISSLPITNHLIVYLPVYIVVVAFIGMVAMFGKPYLSGGGEY